MPEPYSNRELDEKFKNLDTLIREKHDDTMIKVNEVIVQTTKTNGSVANLKKWQERSIGAGSVVLLVLIPILGWALLQISSNVSTIAVLQSKVYTLTHPT